MPLTKLVQIVAGAKVFMVIPVSAYSFPTALANAITAPLLAL